MRPRRACRARTRAPPRRRSAKRGRRDARLRSRSPRALRRAWHPGACRPARARGSRCAHRRRDGHDRVSRPAALQLPGEQVGQLLTARTEGIDELRDAASRACGGPGAMPSARAGAGSRSRAAVRCARRAPGVPREAQYPVEVGPTLEQRRQRARPCASWGRAERGWYAARRVSCGVTPPIGQPAPKVSGSTGRVEEGLEGCLETTTVRGLLEHDGRESLADPPRMLQPHGNTARTASIAWAVEMSNPSRRKAQSSSSRTLTVARRSGIGAGAEGARAQGAGDGSARRAFTVVSRLALGS